MNIHATIALASAAARDKRMNWGQVFAMLQCRFGLSPKAAAGVARDVLVVAMQSQRRRRAAREG